MIYSPSYFSLESGTDRHKYFTKQAGRYIKKTGVCSKCNQRKKTVWANLDGKYLRDKKHYIELCFRCHMQMDKPWKKKSKELYQKSWATRRIKYGIKQCSIINCNEKHCAKGYCKNHYEKNKRHIL